MEKSENESESEKRETLADVVASMRRGTKLPGCWRSCDLNEILAYHADRIEAAWKRERTEIEANSLAVGGMVEAARHEHVGNAAAMRDALELALDALISWLNGTIDRTTNRETIKAIRVALAAPPRQCDVGTADEQSERMEKAVCSKHHGCVRCPLRKAKYSDCSLWWAQTPYAAEKRVENDK